MFYLFAVCNKRCHTLLLVKFSLTDKGCHFSTILNFLQNAVKQRTISLDSNVSYWMTNDIICGIAMRTRRPIGRSLIRWRASQWVWPVDNSVTTQLVTVLNYERHREDARDTLTMRGIWRHASKDGWLMTYGVMMQRCQLVTLVHPNMIWNPIGTMD